MNILITGIGGPTPRSIAKTIRHKYPEAKIIGVDANPRALGFYMPGLTDINYIVPRVNDETYWEAINDIIEKEKPEIAFVQPELEVIGWGEYFNRNKSFPCPVLIPPVELSRVLVDKSMMAEILNQSVFIPKTLKLNQHSQNFQFIEDQIGFPCWIRATKGSGGLGSLKVENINTLKSWLLIHKDIDEFTLSSYLPGRHLATQMLYFKGEYLKGASLECVEYVMANAAPSKVTGNTSYGRFINEDRILEFCTECVEYISKKIGIKAHGVLSFDLKEDLNGNLKVTEINVRHMAYTGVMASIGFDLIDDTIKLLTNIEVRADLSFKYNKNYLFLRDVDTEPIVMENEKILRSNNL